MSPPRQSSPVPPTQEGEALAPRFAALGLLEAALARRSGLDEATSSKAFLALSVRDRAFARALAMATLRHLGPIDALLRDKIKRQPPDGVQNLLRLGVTQIRHLDTPDFAAVATSVDMAEATPKARSFKGMINAVLRAIAREPEPPTRPSDFAPSWLYARWRAAYGEDVADALAAQIKEEPATDLTLRDPDEAGRWAPLLDAVALGGGTLRTERRGDVTEWPGFLEGRWWVQDAAAAIPARLLAPKTGDRVLDLCAAPGGKTLQLAALGARVTAVDRSAARLRRLAENLTRMGLAADVRTADAAALKVEEPYDGVLLDAPCSATGTYRRHPDVLWAARPGDIAKLAAVQSALLDCAADQVRKGGRLVYCVCSLEPEEGEDQTEAFLARHADFEIEPPRPGEGGAPAAALSPSGGLRLIPSLAEPKGGVDGFYIARFRRTLDGAAHSAAVQA